MFKKVRRYLKSPYYALGDDLIKTHPKWMSDKYFIKVFWKQIMSYPLDLRHPKTFNEKLQWIKLYDRNPLYTDLVDKLKVKQWVAGKIGSEHVIPTLAVYNNVDEIKLEDLPDQFVLKCNHDSGGVVICTDKTHFDFDTAKAKLKKNFDHDFYWDFREWVYKNVERKLFAEKFLENSVEGESKGFPGLRDYKFFCFDGIPKVMYISNDRAEHPTTDFFDMSFNNLPIYMKDPKSFSLPTKPALFEEMKEFAKELSKGLRQVRVDFYETKQGVFFGEMTFSHSAGFSEVHPYEWDVRMGDWISLK